MACWALTIRRCVLVQGGGSHRATKNPDTAVERHFRDGQVDVWWVAALTLAGYGPGKRRRAVCDATDGIKLLKNSSRYLRANFPRK